MLATGGIFNWSMPAGRLFGIAIRIHWTLILIALFRAGETIGVAPWWVTIAILAIPFLSVLVHEFGHSLTARAVGGSSNQIIMWMFGGLAMTSVPDRPGARFLTAVMGPVVTAFIAAGCLLAIGDGLWPSAGAAIERYGVTAGYLLVVTAQMNLVLLLFNLIPAYPLDGGAMLRAGLWPIIGRRRAIIVTIYLAYICMAGLMLFAIHSQALWLGVLVMLLLFTVLQEHKLYKEGHDLYAAGGMIASNPYADSYAPPEVPWLERKRREKRAKQAAKAAKREAADDAELDRLLEKVSSAGIQSLTKAERAFLDRTSKARRDDD